MQAAEIVTMSNELNVAGKPDKATDSHLVLTDVSIEFPTKQGPYKALDKVNLKISKGEYISIIGHSGCGKSTVLNIVAGLYKATEGGVILNGREVNEPGPDRAVVFQNHSLLPWLTVYQNVEIAVKTVFRKKKSKAEMKEWILHNLELVHMSHAIHKRPDEISGGMKQRVGIARSLAIEPDIWFLDEPFSALDPLIRKEMQDEFLRLQDVLGKTILFVTHDFDEALRLADRIAIMKDGIIEQLDTPANIVLNPATEYVRKFTEEVPREKVLKIEAVMDPYDPNEDFSDLKVQKDAIIETVAEDILNTDKPVAVVDAAGEIVGALHASHIVHVLFGGRADHSAKQVS